MSPRTAYSSSIILIDPHPIILSSSTSLQFTSTPSSRFLQYNMRRIYNTSIGERRRVRERMSAVRCRLSTVRCPLSAVRCPLSAVRCPLSAVRCPLSAVLSAVRCPVRCPLSTVHCPLSAVRCGNSYAFLRHTPVNTWKLHRRRRSDESHSE
jgi:hypothetical protein